MGGPSEARFASSRPAPPERAGSGRPEQAPLARRPPADRRARPGPGRDRRLGCWRPDHPRRRAGGDRPPRLERSRAPGDARPLTWGGRRSVCPCCGPGRRGGRPRRPSRMHRRAERRPGRPRTGGRRRRHDRALHEHPAAHRGAHGPFQAHLGAHDGGGRGRLFRRRAGALAREGAFQGDRRVSA